MRLSRELYGIFITDNYLLMIFNDFLAKYIFGIGHYFARLKCNLFVTVSD